jgi:S1-C subfamily serine protease
MLNSQPPDRTVSKSQYLLAKVIPVLSMVTITLALPTVIQSELVSSELSEQQEETLEQHIRSIGVKVLAQKEPVGSGILLAQTDGVYTVLTNAHVIQSGTAPFQVQTPDGKIYAAALIPPPVGQTQDIATLRFQSLEREYSTAKLASDPIAIGAKVWSAGYPLESNSDRQSNIDTWGLMIIKGRISRLLTKPLAGGYSLGYDHPIHKGMSGGPLLNQQGELIGINGVHAYPLWDAPEILEDGSTVHQQLQDQINQLNWAIPISVLHDRHFQTENSGQ